MATATHPARRMWLFGVAAVAYLAWLGSYPLLPEEARYAEIARETLETWRSGGDAMLPRLNGVAYVEKPPLLHWLGAAALAVGGDAPEWALRLVPALFSIAAAAAVARYAARAAGPGAGLAAGLVAAVAPLSAALGRAFATDAPFAGALTVALAVVGVEGLERRARLGRLALAGLALAAAALIRGPIAFALFLPIALAGTARRGELGAALRRAAIPAAVAAAAAAPWFVAMTLRQPGFAEEFFVHQHFGRAVAGLGEKALHSEPLWFFLPILIGGFGPAALLVPWAAARAARRWRAEGSGSAMQLPLAAVAWIVLFFSALSGKRAAYVLPALPWIAALVGALWTEAAGDARRSRALALAMAPAAIAGAALAAVLIQAAVRNAPPLDAWAALPVVAPVLAATVAPWLLLRRGAVAAAGVTAAAGLALGIAGVGRALPRFADAGHFDLAMGPVVQRVKLDTLGLRSLALEAARRAQPGDVIADHGRFRPTLAFYTHRLTTLFGDAGELHFGLAAAAGDPSILSRFHREEELADALRGPRRVLAVTNAAWIYDAWRDRGGGAPAAPRAPYAGAPFVVLAQRGRLLLVSNRADG